MPSCSLQLYYTNVSFLLFCCSHTYNEAFIKREPNKQKKDLWAINNCCWWTYSNKKKMKRYFPQNKQYAKKTNHLFHSRRILFIAQWDLAFHMFLGRSSFLSVYVRGKTYVLSLLKWSFEMSISTSLSTFASHLILVRSLGKSQGNNFPYFDGTHAIFLLSLYTNV